MQASSWAVLRPGLVWLALACTPTAGPPAAAPAGHVTSLAAAQEPGPAAVAGARAFPSDQEVQRILSERIGQHAAHYGIVVGLVDRSGRRIVSHGSFEQGSARAVDGDTLFELGSISKVFTALLLQLAVERGEVALDDPLEKHLPPGTKAPAFQGRPITLRHLATHTSGLPRSPANLVVQDPDDPYAQYTVENLYEFLASVQLTREPGSEYSYSNVGAALLARALIVRTGKSYAQLVQERITAPLGLKHTWVDVPEAERGQLATGHTQRLRKAPLRTRIAMIGNGGIISSASDLMTFLSASMGLIETPLASAFQQIARAQRPLADGRAIGLGWHVSQVDGREVISHNGGTAGFSTFAAYVREPRAGVVVLSNVVTPDGVDDIGLHLLVQGPLQPAGALGVTPSLPREPVAVAGELLDAYAGDYQLGASPLVAVQRRGNELRVTVAEKRTLPLVAESQTSFISEAAGLSFRFETDATGKAVAVFLGLKGKEVRMPRKQPAGSATPPPAAAAAESPRGKP